MLYLHSTKTKVIWDAPQARSWRVPTTHVRSPKAFSDGTNGGFIIGYIPLISPFEMAKLYPLSIYITFYSNYIPLYPLKFSILSQLHAITPWYPHSAWLNHVKSPPSHQTPREEWWKRRLTAPQRGHGTSSVNGGFFHIYVIYVSLLPWCLVSMARISSKDSYCRLFWNYTSRNM